jgi:hypothetical protein
VTLQPGSLLMFRDSAFLHSVTPLIQTGETETRRDAMVCTVDYASTYLTRRSVSQPQVR